MERRSLVGGGLAAGMTALFAPAPADAATPAADERDRETATAVRELNRTVREQFDVERLGMGRGIALVRQQQRIWMRTTHKYPDFLEVGLDVWDSVYDWHVINQQPLSVTRLADGRYAMVFMFTTLLLRPDQATDFIGVPFDTETRR